jgi:radical SAM superfamily enzyme YgiQ (UPF0313 family)
MENNAMHYEGTIIRPPSEAFSIILQVAVGCSHNKCTFCGTYKGKRFKIKPESIVMKDIDFAAHYCTHQRRVFLTDGDPLILPHEKLLSLLRTIRSRLPWVTRIGLYANAKSVRMKKLDELKVLRENGLGIVYMGVESGDDTTLKKIRKGASAEGIVAAGKKVRESGIKLSTTVLLGVAGRERSQIHAEKTGKVLSAMDPDHVGALSLILLPNTQLYADCREGKFDLITSKEMLEELKTMFEYTRLSRGLFFANHASNYLPIKARLPRDKDATIELIKKAICGKIPLVPEKLRAL